MDDKLIYIPNDDTQNYPFCRLQLVVKTFGLPTNQNSKKGNKLQNVIIRLLGLV